MADRARRSVLHQHAKFHKNRSMVAAIWRYNDFQNGGRPPSWIFEIRFLRSGRLRDPFCTTVPNFVKTGQTVAEISRFL